ncbi:MAG: Iron-sulfur cluster-binding protein [Olavius algarvensis Delta 4 endosymbiont]|nr:MAG: Iron-sulfur cluster-binding protein [Olavius algarvensis Delta 4 endosymbiont]
MQKHKVSIVRYERPFESVKRAVELADGLANLPATAKVFIKPNIVFWTKTVPFPKWGVITTTRVIEDMVVLLKEYGIDDITIGEGTVTMQPKDVETPAHAFQTLGYHDLQNKYGVKYLNVFERPFQKVDLGGGVELNFNQDILESDLVVDLPVMKAHNQTMVSLGIKNLKGVIDINSRKKCHSPDPEKDLHYMVARLADKMPPMLTLLDGIYTNERGPAFDGKMHRSNLLVASRDVLSADLVGASILGHVPAAVPHLANAAANHGRGTDLNDIEVVGEPIASVAAFHAYDFQYCEEEDVCLPVPLAKQGIKGVFYRKYDTSMCTYCSGVNGVMLTAIRYVWQGEAFDDVEVLTGKKMTPTSWKKKTILLGKCMYKAHKENPVINEMIAVKGCPPKPADIVKALHTAGIPADQGLFENIDQLPGFFMAKYADKPEFDEAFFKAD